MEAVADRTKRGRIRGLTVSVLLLLVACAAALALCPRSAGAQGEAFEDGLYAAEGVVLQATGTTTSMADGAFVRPFHVVAKDGDLHLRATLQPVRTGALTGYLGTISYYPGYEGTTAPEDKEQVKALVLQSFSVTDSFNKLTGTDSDPVVAGKKYPKLVSMALNPDDQYLWLRIYTPLMEGINKGSGTQFVRLKLDYSTMERIGDAPSDEEEKEETQKAAEDQVPSYFSKLSSSIVKANKRLAKTSVYTKASLKKLRKVRDAAVAMFKAKKASSAQVTKQVKAIDKAINSLKKIKKKTKKKTNTKQSSKKKATKSTKSNKTLKIGSLADGTYTISGSMVKQDRKTASMADKGIDHSVRLLVKNGAYHLVLNLKSVSVNGKSSYLSKLRYYKQGYKVASDGTLKGSVSKAKVQAYQKRGSKRVSDAYGSNYPSQVKFPLIPQAKKDGYVPLRVFVPIMESIAAGNGTQNVYLKLDLKSIVAGKQKVKKPKTKATDDSTSTAPTATTPSTRHAGTSLAASTLGDEEESPRDVSVATDSETSNTLDSDEPADSEAASDAAGSLELEEIDETDIPLADGVQRAQAVEAPANTPVQQAAVVPIKQAPLKGCGAYLAAAIAVIGAIAGTCIGFKKRAKLGGGKR